MKKTEIQFILNLPMNTVRYIKSFNKGQFTLPKQIRDSLGIGEDFWLKLYVDNGKIIAEPVQKEKKKLDYKKILLSIKGDWFSEDDYKNIRKEVEEKLKKTVDE